MEALYKFIGVERYNLKKKIKNIKNISKIDRQQPRQTRQKQAYQWIENLSQVFVQPYSCSICASCWLLGAPDKKRFSHTLDSLGRWARTATLFRSAQAATLLEFHVPFTNCFVCRWFCVVHDPKSPLHRHDSVLANSKTQNAFLFTVNAIFRHDYPPSGGTCKYTKAPSTQKKLGEILYLLICFFLPCLSWLLGSRVRKSRRDLWITLYI